MVVVDDQPGCARAVKPLSEGSGHSAICPLWVPVGRQVLSDKDAGIAIERVDSGREILGEHSDVTVCRGAGDPN